jgi:AraC-like DNA-binding protein
MWDLTYVLRGKAAYFIDGVRLDLAGGDLLCVPKGSVRQARAVPEDLMTCYAVNFTLHNGQGRDASLPFPLVSHVGIKKDLIRLFEELSFTWTEQQPAFALKSRSYFLLIIHRLFELISSGADASLEDYRIKKAIRYIVKHYADRLYVGDLAGLAGLNPVYFGALFKKQTGLTVSRYQARTRVRKAENMLRSGEYSVAEVAESCGYSDIYHFYKSFKAVMGMPPSKCIPKREN